MIDEQIDIALSDPHLLGAALGDVATWSTWLAVLRAAFGLPLSHEQQAIFASVAGDRPPPTSRVREFWCIAGRRSAKSPVASPASSTRRPSGKRSRINGRCSD